MFITALGYHHHGLSLPFHVSDTMTKWSEAESFRTRKERIFNSTRYSGLRFVKEGKQKVHGLAQFVAYCIIMCTLWATYVYSIQILFAGEDLAKTLLQYVNFQTQLSPSFFADVYLEILGHLSPNRGKFGSTKLLSFHLFFADCRWHALIFVDVALTFIEFSLICFVF